MQFMLNLSLLAVFVFTFAMSLFLFRLLDRLAAGVKNTRRFAHLAVAFSDALISTWVIAAWNHQIPLVLLILVLDIVWLLEYALLSRDTLPAYFFLGSAVFFNHIMVYIMVYSLYRYLPFYTIEAGAILYHRIVFVTTELLCIVIFMLFKLPAFPANEIKDIIHSRESLLLNIWFPIVSVATLLNSIIIFPVLQSSGIEAHVERLLYMVFTEWGMLCLLSSYIIVFYQAWRIRTKDILLDRLAEEEKLTQAWKEHADRQPLTGLLNRRAWEHKVKEVLSTDGKGYLVMLDLDHFKDVNDNLGHPEGDRILKETADMLQQTFRTSDIIGHIGGDEFCVFLSGDFEKEIVDQRLEHLMSLRRKEFPRKSGGTFCLSLSAGYAAVPDRGASLEDLTAAADAALYWQKEHGRNGFAMFREDMLRIANSEKINVI